MMETPWSKPFPAKHGDGPVHLKLMRKGGLAHRLTEEELDEAEVRLKQATVDLRRAWYLFGILRRELEEL